MNDNGEYTEENLITLHNLLIRNKEDKILTPQEVRLLDNIYENLNAKEYILKAVYSLDAGYKLDKEYNPVFDRKED